MNLLTAEWAMLVHWAEDLEDPVLRLAVLTAAMLLVILIALIARALS